MGCSVLEFNWFEKILNEFWRIPKEILKHIQKSYTSLKASHGIITKFGSVLYNQGRSQQFFGG